MIDERFFLNFPVPFKNLCKIWSPLIKDIVGNEEYGFYKSIIVISQEEIEDIYVEKNIEETPLTPLEYLLAVAYNNKDLERKIKKAFFFFIHEPVTFLYDKKIIVIGDLKKDLKKIKSLEELRLLNEENYFDFQNEVRAAIGEQRRERPNPNEDPRVKRIKAKARYRDKIKAKQGLNLNLSAMLASICCMGIGITPLNIGELSYTAAKALLRYYQEKDKYETDIRSLQAGADRKKINPKYWIRNIED